MEVRREVRLNSDYSPVTPFFLPWESMSIFSVVEVNSNLRVELRVVDAAGNEEVAGWTHWLKIKPARLYTAAGLRLPVMPAC